MDGTTSTLTGALASHGFDRQVPDGADVRAGHGIWDFNNRFSPDLRICYRAVVSDPARQASAFPPCFRFDLRCHVRIQVPLIDANRRWDSEMPRKVQNASQIVRA